MTDKEIKNKCYKFGKDYFGPFLLGFVQWLDKKCCADEIEKVYFFSRDGFMMEKAYRAKDFGRTVRYAHFSRKSIRQALLWHCHSFDESLEFLTDERYVSLGKILDYYGIDESSQKDIYTEYKVDKELLIEFNSIKENSLIKEIYNRNKNIINYNSKQQADLLRKYILQINMCGKCAIIDIGWHGSMQYYLERFFENANIEADLYGYYVGINPSYDIRGMVRGYLFEPGEMLLYKSVMCFHGGFEKLFQSTEGSTAGYQEVDGRVYPQIKDYEYGDNLVSRITMWQNGAMEYVISHNFEDINLVQPALKLVGFGKNPPIWGVEIFRNFFLDDGQSQKFVSDTLFFKYSMKELRHSLGSSVWKTGFLKSLFRIPGPYFLIYKVLKK